MRAVGRGGPVGIGKILAVGMAGEPEGLHTMSPEVFSMCGDCGGMGPVPIPVR